MAAKLLEADKNDVVEGSVRIDESIQILSKLKTLKNDKAKNLMHIKKFRAINKPTFLIFSTKKVFNGFSQAFIKL